MEMLMFYETVRVVSCKHRQRSCVNNVSSARNGLGKERFWTEELVDTRQGKYLDVCWMKASLNSVSPQRTTLALAAIVTELDRDC